jgi:hypothetical protein
MSKTTNQRYVAVDLADPMDRETIARMLDLTPVPRMTKDIRNAARRLGAGEVRFLVDAYYTMQKNRIRAEHQTRTLSRATAEDDEGKKVPQPKPHDVIEWLSRQNHILEQQVKNALDKYSAAHPVGEWAREVLGIGPVICAGLLAGIDIRRAPTVGHIWRICGLNPEDKKRKGEKLVWDPSLKRLCFLLGESFTKVSGRDGAFYGKVYLERKAQEIAKNDAGDFAVQAEGAVRDRDFSKDTLAKAWYTGCFPGGFCARYYETDAAARAELLKTSWGAPKSGVPMLPPGRIQLRAQRFAVKLFLSHLHHVWTVIETGAEPPKPYILTPQGGHAHYIAPPNWPMR